jgi:hypothetical protein
MFRYLAQFGEHTLSESFTARDPTPPFRGPEFTAFFLPRHPASRNRIDDLEISSCRLKRLFESTSPSLLRRSVSSQCGFRCSKTLRKMLVPEPPRSEAKTPRIDLVGFDPGVRDRLQLKRVGDDHPCNVRAQHPNHRHCVAGRFDDDLVILAKCYPTVALSRDN